MNSELFTKSGELRKVAPKKYECKNCGHISSKTKSFKAGFGTFRICSKCRGTIKERDVYIEWSKRYSGQWDLEKEILEFVSKNPLVSRLEVKQNVVFKNDYLFEKTFSDLCYYMNFNILRAPDDTPIYEVKSRNESRSI